MKQTSQRSLLFRQNVNRTEADRRRVCPRHGVRGIKTQLRPRRRAMDRAAVVSMPEIWYTTLCKEDEESAICVQWQYQRGYAGKGLYESSATERWTGCQILSAGNVLRTMVQGPIWRLLVSSALATGD